MSARLALAAAVLIGMVSVSALAADGAALYARHCALCHDAGDGHPGTMRLHARAGPGLAVLLERRDLAADYVAQIVRTGLQMMPPFRPTEISDTDVATLADWLASGGRR